MSAAPEVRRVDKLMSEERCREMMARAYCGRLATAGLDGQAGGGRKSQS